MSCVCMREVPASKRWGKMDALGSWKRTRRAGLPVIQPLSGLDDVGVDSRSIDIPERSLIEKGGQGLFRPGRRGGPRCCLKIGDKHGRGRSGQSKSISGSGNRQGKGRLSKVVKGANGAMFENCKVSRLWVGRRKVMGREGDRSRGSSRGGSFSFVRDYLETSAEG